MMKIRNSIVKKIRENKKQYYEENKNQRCEETKEAKNYYEKNEAKNSTLKKIRKLKTAL